MKYKIIATTKEGVRFENEIENDYEEMMKRVSKLRKQEHIQRVEVYQTTLVYDKNRSLIK